MFLHFLSLFSEELVRFLPEKTALFCDDTVRALWGEKLHAFLQSSGRSVSLFSFPAGEKEKSRERKHLLEDQLMQAKFNRDSLFIALGGGVTSDLIGFLAATFCRGVPLLLIPTTLLAMVDASIGGKTAVNTPYGKNLVGAFYSPEHVVIDVTLLQTLPQRAWLHGLSEVVKYGLIHSPTLLRGTDDVRGLVEKSIAIKQEVVREDPRDHGKRRTLNFGHTIGHALEVEGSLAHGEAVALGMLVESYLSWKFGALSWQDLEYIRSVIAQWQLAPNLPNIQQERLLARISYDKKGNGSKPRFVLLNGIGSCCPFDGEYCTELPLEWVKQGIEWLYQTQEAVR